MTTQLLSKHQMLDAKPKSVPISSSIKLTKDEGEPLNKEKYGYSQLVGSLMYLTVCTRPDIAQAVGALAKYMAAPTLIHWAAATESFATWQAPSTMASTLVKEAATQSWWATATQTMLETSTQGGLPLATSSPSMEVPSHGQAGANRLWQHQRQRQSTWLQQQQQRKHCGSASSSTTYRSQ